MSDVQIVSDMIEVRGAKLWHEITGDGEPVVQIHGSGFGHFNFGPATPILSKEFRLHRLRPARLRPVRESPSRTTTWRSGPTTWWGSWTRSTSTRRTSTGPRWAAWSRSSSAANTPSASQSVVINCAAAKLGFSGQLVFKNWIDLIKLEGCGSRILAELIAWQCLSRAYMETPEGQAGVDTIQQILRDANEDRVMIDACQAMIDMDLREWVPKNHSLRRWSWAATRT